MYNHILIPVEPNHPEVSEQALATAKRLLNEGGKISALSVIEEIPSFVDTYVLPDYPNQMVKAAKKTLSEAFVGEDVETRVTTGMPPRSILDSVEKEGVDCIVISSHRPGFSDFFLGSTAAKVVRHAPCAVMVLR